MEMDFTILKSAGLTEKDIIYILGITPKGYEAQVEEFLRKNSVTNEQLETAYKKVSEKTKIDPYYFEQI